MFFFVAGRTNQGAPEYTLTVTSAHGTVAKDPDQETYHKGDTVQLTATASEGYEFSAWSGDITSSDNPTNVTITGDMTVTAGYDPYLLQEEFTTPATAPLANPLTMEPGGTVVTTWALTDPVPKLSKSGGEFIQGTGGSNNATKIKSTQALPHAAGRAVGARFTTIPTNGICYLRLYPTDTARRGFEFVPSYNVGITVNPFYGVSNLRAVAATSPRTAIIVWRDNGTAYWIADDYLIYASDVQENADKNDSYVWTYNYLAAETMNLNWVRSADLGAPFNTDFALATSRTASPVSGQTGTHEADFNAYFKWTAVAAETLVWNFRKSDATNYYQLVCDQAAGTIKLYRVVAGTPTELNAGKTQTWTAGQVFRITIHALSGSIYTGVGNISTGVWTAKHVVTGETHNLTATQMDISGFATGANFEAYPMTLTGAAKTEKDRFFS